MKVILIDDDPLAIQVLNYVLQSYRDIQVVNSYTNPYEALEEVETTKPDIAFIDIEMGEISGLELAKLLTKALGTLDIVFVTAHSQYGVDAFELNAVDYLLKPIQKKRLDKTIEKLREMSKKKIHLADKKIKIISFGIFQVLDRDGNPLFWRTQKTKELFAYLWCNEKRMISKSILLETIFPDNNLEKANTLLHTTIYQLRKTLEDAGFTNAITYYEDYYILDIDNTSDTYELDNLLNLKKHTEENIQHILNIYGGDFMGEEAYSWAMDMKEQYREKTMIALENFAKEELKEMKLSFTLKACLDKMYSIDPYGENVAKLMTEYCGIQNKKNSLESFFNNYKENLSLKMDTTTLKNNIQLYKDYMKKK